MVYIASIFPSYSHENTNSHKHSQFTSMSVKIVFQPTLWKIPRAWKHTWKSVDGWSTLAVRHPAPPFHVRFSETEAQTCVQRETCAFDNVSPSHRHSPGALKAVNDREGRRPFVQKSATFARTVSGGWPPMLIEIIEIVKRRRAPALSHPVVIPRDVKSTGKTFVASRHGRLLQ